MQIRRVLFIGESYFQCSFESAEIIWALIRETRCTVLLGVTLTGEKLPPFIIFKGMPNGRVAQEVYLVDSNVVCTVQKNAWMDGDALRMCSEFAKFANVSLMGT